MFSAGREREPRSRSRRSGLSFVGSPPRAWGAAHQFPLPRSPPKPSLLTRCVAWADNSGAAGTNCRCIGYLQTRCIRKRREEPWPHQVSAPGTHPASTFSAANDSVATVSTIEPGNEGGAACRRRGAAITKFSRSAGARKAATSANTSDGKSSRDVMPAGVFVGVDHGAARSIGGRKGRVANRRADAE